MQNSELIPPISAHRPHLDVQRFDGGVSIAYDFEGHRIGKDLLENYLTPAAARIGMRVWQVGEYVIRLMRDNSFDPAKRSEFIGATIHFDSRAASSLMQAFYIGSLLKQLPDKIKVKVNDQIVDLAFEVPVCGLVISRLGQPANKFIISKPFRFESISMGKLDDYLTKEGYSFSEGEIVAATKLLNHPLFSGKDDREFDQVCMQLEKAIWIRLRRLKLLPRDAQVVLSVNDLGGIEALVIDTECYRHIDQLQPSERKSYVVNWHGDVWFTGSRETGER